MKIVVVAKVNYLHKQPEAVTQSAFDSLAPTVSEFLRMGIMPD